MDKKLIKLILTTSIGTVFSVLSSFLLARILNIQDRGAFQIFITTISYIAILSSGGLGFAITLSIKNNSYRNWHRFLLIAVIISIIITLIISIIFYDKLYWLLVINVLYIIISNYVIEISKSYSDLKIYARLNILQPIIMFCSYAIIYLVYGETYIDVVTSVYTIAMSLQIIFCAYCIISIDKELKIKIKNPLNNKFVKKKWIKQNLLQIVGATVVNIDKFIIAFFLGNYTLGLYAIGMSFDALITRFINVIADYYYSGLINNLNRIKTAILVVVLFLIIIVSVVPFVSDELMSIAFGEKYLSISSILVLFLINSILAGASWILSQKMIILGKQALIISRQLIAMLAFILLFYLIKEKGIYAVICALLFSSTIRLIISIFFHIKYKLPSEQIK